MTLVLYLCALSASQWQRGKKGTGEENLVYQGEFQSAQDRDKEIQNELKDFSNSNRTEIMKLKDRVNDLEFESRLQKRTIDIGIQIMWGLGGLLLLQVIVPLIRRGLRTEIEQIAIDRRKGGLNEME